MEYSLEIIAPGDYHAHGDGSKVEEQAEVVEIAVVERILVVPLDFQRHPVLEAVDLMGRGLRVRPVDDDLRLELLLLPSEPVKPAVNGLGDFRLATAADGDPASKEPEIRQHRDDVVKFLRKILFEDGAGVLPFVDFVVFAQERGKNVCRHRSFLGV